MELNPVFARRLYLSWLISSAEALNVPRLMTLTGWPRRTLQDVLKALPGLGVTLTFVQHGVRNNAGYYQLESWGPLNKRWIQENHDFILAAIK
ncbi:helix-turn-helix domain-containing protein [Yersinia pestis subsp. pestis]|nr:helix-turn-helix domain-containing protein [Yersinia pestis]MCF2950844.1 helix-turn-helix domain-containing protein [Yersinia pestis subsp. pestis]MCF2959754.1 helix-turn-helix domain-containing protein [Yersinia pestis subsp. pestis]